MQTGYTDTDAGLGQHHLEHGERYRVPASDEYFMKSVFFNMRDRRNTNLSVSSTSSSGSSPSSSCRTSNEKRHSSPPPPSPTLPAPVTEKYQARPRRRPLRTMALKLVAVACTVLLLWRCFMGSLSLGLAPPSNEPSETDLVGGDTLPLDPTAFIITDHGGRSRWTVSIPRNSSFPLRAKQYKDLCTQADSFKAKLERELPLDPITGWRRKNAYGDVDRNFLDVAEAETSGILPVTFHEPKDNVCERSLTFAMDTEDASFGKMLLLLWQSYGLAKKEDRAFFIDDTRWPYGKYTSYFAPPPAQGCSPPPAHHILPCPHSARHLLVSAATAQWTFGETFTGAYTNRRKYGQERSREIFDLIRAGYKDLFQLIGEDASYAASRVANMKEDAASHGGSVVGMHVRRGDLHPSEYQFSRDYLPLSRYSSAARSLFRSLLSTNDSKANAEVDDFSTVLEYIHSLLLLASDDPEIISNPELSQAAAPFEVQRAQERITLATKATLDKTSPVKPLREEGSAYVKHIDENSGWEGGFYSALFFSLGNPAKKISGAGTLEKLNQWPVLDGDEAPPPVPEQAMRMRELVGRAYLLDLTVLGQSDGVVCAVSSAACRVLGVMMGWEAVKGGRWVNVDDGRPWSWDGRR